ncbi:MAG: glycerol kinase GlpK [Caulobacteraceae bacterium]|nr:glycerol kinase GlpK [Caulobacter sp.]
MAAELILAIDQGTTSSRALVFDAHAQVVSAAQAELPQVYPREGWVEHDPEAIWATTLSTAREAMARAEARGGRVVAIGLANQRETAIVWERRGGRPIHNAIVWQDRRTAGRCRDLEAQGALEEVRARTGLLLDPYFSATKAAWLLDHVEGARERAERGELAFGTVDSFLLWRLTEGATHATDATNASRTSLYNIHQGAWSDALCALFGAPRAMLPEVRDSSGDFGTTPAGLFGRSLPILGMLGDQQAALTGHACLAPGDAKCTFGTGGFLLVNTGAAPVASRNRLLTTVALQLEGRRSYALEGSIFVAGAAVQWLRDGLGVIGAAAETHDLAGGLEGNGGVYLVPAFTGLGAPHWDPDARGALFGLTRATGPAQLARAALEAVAYQTHDLLAAVAEDGAKVKTLRVDGGLAANDWAMQFLADIAQVTVARPASLETTALGAAYMAGRRAGVYGDLEAFRTEVEPRDVFAPRLPDAARARLLAGWRDAVSRTLSSPRT